MKEFIQKVAEMRALQKKYFKYRDPLSLQEAKKAEKEIDAELANMGFVRERQSDTQQTMKF